MRVRVHPLHFAVGDLFEDNLTPNCRLIRDEACGGDQQIPLFSSKEKSWVTELCNVDLLVIKDGKINIIVEIEESNRIPTQICGKFITSALARYYIHESENNVPIGMHDSVKFIQVLDTSNLTERTSKFKQWENLEKSIMNILPIRSSNIKEYRLFYGNESYFRDKDKCSELVDFIKMAC